jgi:Fur family ferric uptake transcriptional regulator
VRSADHHVTAEEISAQVKAQLPDVNLSTVYRTLDLLVSLDLVSETRLGGSRTYFEVAPEPVHHHFVCRSCGLVGHFSDRLLGDLYVALDRDEGFAPEGARATVFGVCEACRSTDTSAAGDSRNGDVAPHARP